MIVSAIVALLAVGVWALWWDDVRGVLHLGPEKPVETTPTTPAVPAGPGAASL
jgi:hypothetical protein